MASTAEKHHQAALDYLGQGDSEAALTAIERSLAADFTWAASHATHGLVLANRGDRLAARRAVSAALKLDPLLPYAHFACGVLLQDEDPDQAIEELETAQRGDPDNPRFSMQLAVAYLKRGDEAAARSRLLATIESDPENTTAYILLADLAMMAGDRAEAIRLTDCILAIDPDHGEALLVRCQLALLEGDGAVLTRCSEELLARDPGNQRALELAALGSLSRSVPWRPWWWFLSWRARSDQRKVTLLALLALGGILALSLLLVTVAPDLAVGFHAVLWLLFAYLVAAHHQLAAPHPANQGRGACPHPRPHPEDRPRAQGQAQTAAADAIRPYEPARPRPDASLKAGHRAAA